MATVTNLVPNPRAASNVTGWEAGPNSSGAPSQVTDAAFPLGTAGTETSTPANSTTATGLYVLGLTSFLAVTAGDVLVVRCKAKVHAGTGTPQLRLQMIFADSGGVSTGTYFADIRDKCSVGTTSASVYELIGFAKAPASTARLSVAVTQLGSTGSTIVRVSECLVYKNPPAGVGLAPYADSTATYTPPVRDQSVLLTGFNDNAPNRGAQNKLSIGQWVSLLKELGVDCIRFGSPADTAAVNSLSPSAGVFNFGYWEPWLNAAIRAGIRPILISPLAPSRLRGSDAYIPDSAHLGEYADLCAAFAARFPEAAAFEVWNEPNIVWGGAAGTTVDVPAYVAMLQAVYPKVKAAAPNMPVLGGASAQIGFNAGVTEITADSFWSQFYSNGGKNFCDGLSLHPYSQLQAPTIATTASSLGLSAHSMGLEEHIRIVRKYKDANTDSAKPLWLTEGGGSSASGFYSEADQATYNRLYVELMRDRTRHPDVRYVGFNQMVHHVTDGSYGEGLQQVPFGTFKRKPSVAEVAAACGGSRPARTAYPAPVNLKRPVVSRA